jgi:VanZ family protein
MYSRRTLRSFHLTWLWLAVWGLMILGVIVLSLMRGPPIPELLVIGKIDHFIAYVALAAFAVQLFASRNAQSVAALAMVVLGILLELAQGYLTTYRDMSLYDACVDSVGVAAGLATSWMPLANLLQKMEGRFAR